MGGGEKEAISQRKQGEGENLQGEKGSETLLEKKDVSISITLLKTKNASEWLSGKGNREKGRIRLRSQICSSIVVKNYKEGATNPLQKS